MAARRLVSPAPLRNGQGNPGLFLVDRWLADAPILSPHVIGLKIASMPTVLRVGPYRFFFYSSDRDEPRHVHVERDRSRAKFWLEPVRLEGSGGFSSVELNRIAGLVEEHREQLVGAWGEFFGKSEG